MSNCAQPGDHHSPLGAYFKLSEGWGSSVVCCSGCMHRAVGSITSGEKPTRWLYFNFSISNLHTPDTVTVCKNRPALTTFRSVSISVEKIKKRIFFPGLKGFCIDISECHIKIFAGFVSISLKKRSRRKIPWHCQFTVRSCRARILLHSSSQAFS